MRYDKSFCHLYRKVLQKLRWYGNLKHCSYTECVLPLVTLVTYQVLKSTIS